MKTHFAAYLFFLSFTTHISARACSFLKVSIVVWYGSKREETHSATSLGARSASVSSYPTRTVPCAVRTQSRPASDFSLAHRSTAATTADGAPPPLRPRWSFVSEFLFEFAVPATERTRTSRSFRVRTWGYDGQYIREDSRNAARVGNGASARFQRNGSSSVST